MNTVWMWQDDDHTRGVNLDVERRVLVWQEDLVGFGCSLMPLEQPLDDFRENGPARYGTPPADVLAEIRAAVQALSPP